MNQFHSKPFFEKTYLSIIFLFIVNTTFAQVPTTQDCLGAIPICSQVYSESASPTGAGNYPNEINGTSQGGICCMDTESNSTWYTFTVNTSGEFGFTLTPNASNDDYDWAMFDITNATCADIFNNISLQVSCNAAGGGSCNGPTGANGLDNFNNQGAGCGSPPSQFAGFSPHNALIPVTAGNTYVLVVSNWSGSPNGYSIDFGVSGNIGIIDNTVPTIVEMVVPDDCSGDEFEVTFSEYIQCNTITGSNFVINGPGGPYDAIVNSDVCASGGDYDKTFTVFVNPPILEPGNFTIEMVTNGVDQVLDLCENPATPASFDFEILNVPLSSLDIGNDTILCEGGSVTLNANIPFAEGFTWQDGSNQSTLTVTQTGTYSVNVTNVCNELYDEVFVEFVALQTVDVDLGEDMELCPGELYQLDATWDNGIDYIWQDGFSGPNYTVSEAGYYEVMISGACGEMGTAGIEITYDETQLSLNLGVDTLLCEDENDILPLNATDLNAETYEWQDGSTDPIVTVSEEGTYAVTITDECNVVVDSIVVNYTNCTICEIFIPNGFTPDFNGFNDEFKPYSNCEVMDYSIKVFNRWGAMVFESDNIEIGWNGTFDGRNVPEGVYVYWIEYRVNQMEDVLQKRFGGDVTVMR